MKKSHIFLNVLTNVSFFTEVTQSTFILGLCCPFSCTNVMHPYFYALCHEYSSAPNVNDAMTPEGQGSTKFNSDLKMNAKMCERGKYMHVHI